MATVACVGELNKGDERVYADVAVYERRQVNISEAEYLARVAPTVQGTSSGGGKKPAVPDLDGTGSEESPDGGVAQPWELLVPEQLTPIPDDLSCPPPRPESCNRDPILILQSRTCALSACHGTTDEKPTQYLDLAYNTKHLAGRLSRTYGSEPGCQELLILDAEQPVASLLLQKLLQDLDGPGCGLAMPPTPAFRQVLFDNEKQCLIDWVFFEAACLQKKKRKQDLLADAGPPDTEER